MTLAEEIVRLGLLRFGRFRLSSGMESPVYVDLRGACSHPPLFRAMVRSLSDLVRRGRHDAVCGVAVSGLPLATGVALELGLPLLYWRPRRKDHGTMAELEGIAEEGWDVAVVDDVSTTGSSILRAVWALRRAGVRVRSAYVVVDRGEGAEERLGSEGVRLRWILRLDDLLERVSPGAPAGPAPEGGE